MYFWVYLVLVERVHEISLQITISSIFNYYSSIFCLSIAVFLFFFFLVRKDETNKTKKSKPSC